VLAIRDGDEAAPQLQQQSLLRRRLERVVPAQSLEEVADLDTERLSDLVQASSGDAVDPLLVALLLLAELRHRPVVHNRLGAVVPLDVPGPFGLIEVQPDQHSPATQSVAQMIRHTSLQDAHHNRT
jgi:hypothetical protein